MEKKKSAAERNAERAEKVKALTDKLEKGVSEFFTSEKYQNYLKTMSKFHNYSPRNTLLIILQNPNASQVAGFNSWKKNFQRNVKKGEKGIAIFAPCPYQVYIEKTDKYGKPIIGKDGEPEKDLVDKMTFKIEYVFDVSQTEGKELPKIAEKLTANVHDFQQIKNALVSISPVPVEFTEIPGTANGYFSQTENKIAIRDDLSQSHTLKTLIHEITHATLHTENTDKKRNIEEIEAESVAYVVAQHLGIDSSDYSFGYVARWSSEKTTAELQEHLENIHKCAVKIIDQLDKTLEKTEKAVFSANDIKNITEIDIEVKEKNEQEIGKGE